jgi:DNA-binding NarL/FixJ family response regulator
MVLLLSSRSDSVRQRWLDGLGAERTAYQASSVKETLDYITRFAIDIVLLHRSLIETEDLEKISREATAPKVIVFSDRPNDQEGLVCLQRGCVGYTNTYITHARLKAAVDAVQSGLVWVNSSLMAMLINGVVRGPAPQGQQKNGKKSALLKTLSPREHQIALLVAEGWKNNRVAEELDITERTVKAHLSSIYEKTRTKGRLNLALLMKKG